MSLHKPLMKDVSPKAVKKSVLSAATQQPLTIYPAAISVLGAAFALLIGVNFFSLAAIGIGGVVTSLSWLWEYFAKGNDHASRFVSKCRAETENRRRAALAQLQKDMQEAGDEQGLKQIQLFKEKYDNFVQILSRKLNESELTYQRYLIIAEQVFLGGLDNLENAALTMKSVSAIDLDHIEQTLAELQNSSDEASRKKAAELQARLALRESQMLRASALLLENEQALTQLDHVTTKIAEIKTQQNRAQVDLEDAMAELQHLITRAETYSK